MIFFSLFGNCRMFVMIPINQSCFQSGHGKCIVKQGLTWILDRLRLTVVYVPLPGCTDSSAERLEENRCRQMSLSNQTCVSVPLLDEKENAYRKLRMEFQDSFPFRQSIWSCIYKRVVSIHSGSWEAYRCHKLA